MEAGIIWKGYPTTAGSLTTWVATVDQPGSVAELSGHTRDSMVLVDGNALPKWRHPARAIVSGDALSRSIAAASIIAKVTRDRMMQEYDGQYPGYGWRQNKGYGTAEHRAALIELGPTPLHRRSFAPVAQLCLAL